MFEMNEEKMMILKMLQDGKISAKEAAKLLESLDSGEKEGKKKKEHANRRGKFIRVKVTDTKTGKSRANIRVPINLLRVANKFGGKFNLDIDGVTIDEIQASINDGNLGKIVDVYDDEEGEHVEVFIE